MELKALILAGGVGTRLRPLSCTRPKLLFPIANRPLLDLTIERLAKNGVEEVILAVNFMAERLEAVFGKTRYGVTLHYSRDKPPKRKTPDSQKSLGTGGPIRQAEKLLGKEEPFFVLNGDILADVDYSEILDAHQSYDATATLALHRVEDPSRFGVAKLTKENRIEAFVEKPKKNTPSNLANAGIYVLEPDIFQYIQAGKRCSIEREVFPKLAEERKLFGHEIKGLWVDVGKPADYIKANTLWLAAKSKDGRSTKISALKGTRIKENVAIGSGVQFGEISIIGPNVSVGKEVRVGNRVHIENSVIFPHTTISDYSTIKGAVVGEHVTLGRNVRIEEGCLVGDYVTIQDNTTLSQNVKVCPSKKVDERTTTSQCIV